MSLSKLQILALNEIPGVGKKKILKIGKYLVNSGILEIHPEDIIDAIRANNIKKKVQGIQGNQTISIDDYYECERKAKEIIEKHKNGGIGVITYFEDGFPQLLRDTIDEDGNPDPPIAIFYKGEISLLECVGIAIIGTRDITSYGIKAGTYLSKEFARRGLTIVSGLALGCDTIAHRAALDVNGKTIAILAHGLDSIYPVENLNLANDIIRNGGLLLSEYPMGTKVNRYNLVARDRLQAALANATLVIQTSCNGGTMHAANTTLKSGKSLYVTKFSNADAQMELNSQGNALLVSKGGIYLSATDNLDMITEAIKEYKKNKLLNL